MEICKDFIGKNKWTFAKTMAKIPHEWVCKNNLDEKSKIDFDYFVSYIREKGFKAVFFHTTYTYLEIDGYYYWTMGYPLDQTIIINRASLDIYEAREVTLSDGRKRTYMFMK